MESEVKTRYMLKVGKVYVGDVKRYSIDLVSSESKAKIYDLYYSQQVNSAEDNDYEEDKDFLKRVILSDLNKVKKILEIDNVKIVKKTIITSYVEMES